MEEDIKYITPKMIFYKHLCLGVKQRSLGDVYFTHRNICYLDSY